MNSSSGNVSADRVQALVTSFEVPCRIRRLSMKILKPRRPAESSKKENHRAETCWTMSAWLSVRCPCRSTLVRTSNSRPEWPSARASIRRRTPRTRRGGGTFAEVEERSPRSEAGSRRDWEARDRGNESHPRRCERVAEARGCVGARKRRKARGREDKREKERAWERGWRRSAVRAAANSKAGPTALIVCSPLVIARRELAREIANARESRLSQRDF